MEQSSLIENESLINDGVDSDIDQEVIEVNDLKKHFPVRQTLFSNKNKGAKLKAVDGVSFSIKKGHSLGLAGESGCGKTTTAKMLLKLHDPTAGTFIFNGQDVDKLETKREIKDFRKKAQLMFQNPFEALNPRFTIYRSLLEPLIIHDIGKKEERPEIIYKALKQVNLLPADAFFEKYPHQLSGGQLQRVVLARALIVNPDFLVADEPVSMLDVSVRAGVLNLMKEVTERMKLTTVYISHDLSLIQYMCEDVAIMYLGEIVEIGDTKTVLENPQHPYTKALIGAVAVPDPEVEKEEMEISNNIPSPINLPEGCNFQNRCPFVQDVCHKVSPTLKTSNSGAKVACHLVD